MSDTKKALTGELIAHGADNYLHDPTKSTNYYAQIRQDDGTIAERWSKNLEEVIKNSGVQTGDKVILTELGKEPVMVGDKIFNKMLWDLQKYEPALELPNVIEYDSERELKKLAPTVSADKTKENEQEAPSQPKKPNLSDFDFELPSNIKNNYIAITKNRFLQDEKVNYYDKNDKDQVNIAFEDRSKSLHTSRQDEKTIHAMLDLAQSKGWSAIKIKGTEEFKQKAWLEASLRGIEVKGYTPTEKDLAQLQVKQSERTTNQVEMTAQKPIEAKQEQTNKDIMSNKQTTQEHQNTNQLDDLDKSTLEMIKSLNAQEVQNLSEQDFNKRLKSIENPLQDSNFLVFQALRTGNDKWVQEAKHIADLNEKSYLSVDVVEKRYSLSEQMRVFLEKDTNKQDKKEETSLINHKEDAEKPAQEIKNEIRKIFQNGYKDGTINSRDDLVAVLKERGFEIKENDKSIRVSLPNSDQAVNLKGEVFTKGYDAIKSLKERLEPEKLKQTYPNLKDSDIAHITAYKNKLFDDNKNNHNPKILQASLVQLETGVKDLAKGKELNLPNLPVNEIKPDVQVRTTDNHDKSRQM